HDLLSALFFFSSRRRHTSSKRDWSSDVCSSDLIDYRHTDFAEAVTNVDAVLESIGGADQVTRSVRTLRDGGVLVSLLPVDTQERSEERRVGKERRSRRSTHHTN